jgi:hypothetical protein
MFAGSLPVRRSGRYTAGRGFRGEHEPFGGSGGGGVTVVSGRSAAARAAALTVVFVVAFACAASGQSPSEDFSETRLRDGKEAYEAHRPLEAIDNFRIAAFGFLDRPALLCESLIYLAVADAAAERHADAQATVDRLLELQRTIPACAQAKVSPAVRSTFETRFRQLLPGSVPPAASRKGTLSSRTPPPGPTPRSGG